MRTKLVIAAVVTAGAVSAVGASAYTESITGGTTTKVIGYTTTAITGAAMDTPPVLHYSTGLDQIDSIDVVLTGDTHSSTLSVNRNAAAAVPCAAERRQRRHDLPLHQPGLRDRRDDLHRVHPAVTSRPGLTGTEGEWFAGRWSQSRSCCSQPEAGGCGRRPSAAGRRTW